MTMSELETQRVGGQHANFIDALPFVWNKFEQAGYVTLYAEDFLVAGADTFHMDFYGFEQVPVHHYMRPFWQAAGDLQAQDVIRSGRRDGCLGTRPEYLYVLDYVDQFLAVADGQRAGSYPAHVPRFAFASVSGSAAKHPTSVRRFDEDLSLWLNDLRRSGMLERTAIIVVGDHGPSYGSRRQTELGKVTERLPLLVVTVPTGFVERHSVMAKNLKANNDRLVTPLDVHQTLLALLAAQENTTEAASLRQMKGAGISLLDEIPIGRTCQSAGVPVHWCMCTYTQPVAASQMDDDWTVTGHWVVSHINSLLDTAVGINSEPLCQRLALRNVVTAQYVLPTDLVVEVENRYYTRRRLSNFTGAHPTVDRYQQVVVRTTPNDSTFEATVVFNPLTKARQLSGDVSRVSAYDHQSDCILDLHPELRRFCTCN